MSPTTKPIDNPSKLEFLAEWIDAKYPGDLNPEMQNDLRRMAREMRGYTETMNRLHSLVTRLGSLLEILKTIHAARKKGE